MDEGRRKFLLGLSFGVAGAGALGLSYLGLRNTVRSLEENAASKAGLLRIDYADLATGETMLFEAGGRPLIFWKRSAQDIADARLGEDGFDFRDNDARLAGKEHLAPYDHNRAFGDHGQFLLIIAMCTRLGCVVVPKQGDFGGFFCPCCASHYDKSGRTRKGHAQYNMTAIHTEIDQKAQQLIFRTNALNVWSAW